MSRITEVHVSDRNQVTLKLDGPDNKALVQLMQDEAIARNPKTDPELIREKIFALNTGDQHMILFANIFPPVINSVKQWLAEEGQLTGVPVIYENRAAGLEKDTSANLNPWA